jgi:hypothetical protein
MGPTTEGAQPTAIGDDPGARGGMGSRMERPEDERMARRAATMALEGTRLRRVVSGESSFYSLSDIAYLVNQV